MLFRSNPALTAGQRDLIQEQRADPELMAIISNLLRGTLPSTKIERRSLEHYFIDEKGFLCRKPEREISEVRLVIPNALQASFLEQMHSTVLAGHFALEKTYARLQRRYFWKKMHKSVKRFCSNCMVCIRAKARLKKRAGMLMPTLALYPFQRIHMDFVGPLPVTKRGNKNILTCVDRFTRFCFFIPTKNQTADVTARAIF